MTPAQRKRERRRKFAVSGGAYLAILTGVVFQSVIRRIDWHTLAIEFSFGTWNYLRVGVALVGSTIIYVRYRREGELDRKIKYADKILATAFAKGFTMMGLASIGEQIGG